MGSTVKSLFGGREDTGILGTGQYRAKEYKIDKQGVLDASVGQNANAVDARAQQNAFIQQLQNQAAGNGPSIAQDQLRQATDRTVAQAQAAAQSGRGQSAAMAARTALQAGAQANQESANQSSQLRNQEMQQATNSLGSNISNLREQDVNIADSDRAARLGLEQLGVQQQTGLNSANQAGYADAASRRGNLIGGIAQGMTSMSDEKNKVEVGAGEVKPMSKTQKFAAALKESYAKDDEKKTAAESGQTKTGTAIGRGIGAAFQAFSDEMMKEEIKEAPAAATEVAKEVPDSAPTDTATQEATAKAEAPTSTPVAIKEATPTAEAKPEVKAPEVKAAESSMSATPAKVEGPTDTKAAQASTAAGASAQPTAPLFRPPISHEGFKQMGKAIGGANAMESIKGASGGGGGEGGGGDMMQTVMKVGSMAAMMSDKNNKTEQKSTEPAKRDLKEFIDALGAHKYKYKDEFKNDPAAGDGTYVSPMAQEFEKSKLGKDMVMDTPKGKMVDYGKGLGTIVASQAALNERLSDIEQAFKARKSNKGK